MATTYTLTGSLSDAGVPFGAKKVSAWIALENVDALLDTTTDTLILGRWPVEVDTTTGDLSEVLPSTAAGAGYSPDGGFVYRLYVEYRDAAAYATRKRMVSGAFELTANSTLAEVLEGTIELRAVSAAEWADFQAKYDEIAAIVASTDGLVATVVADNGSLTTAELQERYAHLAGGTLVINGAPVSVPPPDASTTVKGVVELATNTEAATGTDTARAITPAALVRVARDLAAPPIGVWKPRGWGSQFWHPALASSGSSLARVAVVGDSIMRGYFSSNLDTKGYVALLRTALQTQYGDGGSGFKGSIDTNIQSPAAYQAINYFSKLGTWTANTGIRKNGPGGYVIQPGALNDWVEGVVRGTTVEIFVVDANPFKGFQYSISGHLGGAVQTQASSAANGIMRVVVTGLAPGNHTVRVISHQGATYFSGISGRNTSGVVVDNYGVQGSKAEQWNGLDNTGALTNVYEGGTGAWSGGYKRPADLILYGSILNDSSGGNESAYMQDLKRFLDAVRGPTATGTAPGALYGQQDVAIILPHAGHFDNASTHRYHLIAREARAMAEEYGAAFINFWPIGRNSWDYWNSLGYWSDGTSASGAAGTDGGHPSDAGFQFMYNRLVAELPELLGPV